MHMRSVLVVAKFKTRQYVLMTDSPNLMLAKFSRYTILSKLVSHWLGGGTSRYGVCIHYTAGRLSQWCNFRIFRMLCSHTELNMRKFIAQVAFDLRGTHRQCVKQCLCNTYGYFAMVLKWSDLHDPSELLPASISCATVLQSTSAHGWLNGHSKCC